jgi:hypothetical protein
MLSTFEDLGVTRAAAPNGWFGRMTGEDALRSLLQARRSFSELRDHRE